MNYTTLASRESIDKTTNALKSRNIEVIFVETRDLALAKIQELVPRGASIMNGASKTLEEIGFIEYLKSGAHGWNNLHESIIAEKDPVKQGMLRKQAVLSEYYVGSVHALTESGEFVIASNTGSQLPHVVFTSPNLIFVVGAEKIVPTLTEALERLEKHVVPLEDASMMQKYKIHTAPNKVLLFRGENPMMGRTVKMILVNENLGF